MVCGKDAFAFAAVQKNGIYLFICAEFYCGGEGGAAHAHDAFFTDNIDNFLRGETQRIAVAAESGIEGILAIGIDDNA